MLEITAHSLFSEKNNWTFSPGARVQAFEQHGGQLCSFSTQYRKRISCCHGDVWLTDTYTMYSTAKLLESPSETADGWMMDIHFCRICPGWLTFNQYADCTLVFLEKVVEMSLQLMNNGNENKSVAFIFLFIIFRLYYVWCSHCCTGVSVNNISQTVHGI